MGKTVAVIVRDSERHYEALRTALGLLLEDHVVSLFVLDHPVQMTEAFQENMELFEEMDGALFSTVPANVDGHGFDGITLDALAGCVRECDLVIPF